MSDIPFICCGAMSDEIIKTLKDISSKYNKKISLVCSRNQVDSKSNGGGYVDKFKYSSSLKKLSSKNFSLSRDHCGPYFKDKNYKFTLNKELKSCKKTIYDDIKNNFKYIHIDTSKCEKRQYEIGEELINFTNQTAQTLKKEVFIEYGKENHGKVYSINSFKKDLNFLKKFPNIKYLVCQTGSLVNSAFNVGQFEYQKIKIFKKLAQENNILLKEHNADYMSKYDIDMRKALGIDSVNIAPELSTIQNKIIYFNCLKYDLQNELKKFSKFVISNNKWKKWSKSSENNYIKFLVSAHYFYGTENYRLLKNKLKKKVNIDKEIKNEIFNRIKVYF